MQFIKQVRTATPVALLIAGLLPTGAFAHEHRDIDNGKYTIVVGWETEPAIQGQANAATVRISMADRDPAMPVEGADQTLRLQIQQGDMTMQLPLHAVAGKPGSYAAELTPDRAGDVEWTLSGTLDGDAIAERFESADGKFDAVQPAATADAAPAASTAASTDAGMARTDFSGALDALDKSGLHDLDMSLEAGSLPADAMQRIHQAELVMTTTAWPLALQDAASQLSAQLDQVHEAIEAGDLTAAMQPAHEAHELSHAFGSQARAWLAAQTSAADAASVATTAALHMDMDGSHAAGMADDQD